MSLCYIAYTDSGYHIGCGKGAYAYILLCDGEIVRKEAFTFMHESNNRGELHAIIAALEACPDGASVEIRTDSQYAHNTLTGEWLQRRNTDLFARWHALVQGKKLKVKVVWIRSHSGDIYNEMCDDLCCQTADTFLRNINTVMLIGPTGFMGRHMKAMLCERGFNVKPYAHADLDITDPDAVMKAVMACRPDIVINCAAISSTGYAKDHPDESMAINVDGPCNIARACRASGSRFYTMSSDQVYGGCPVPGPLPEGLELTPNNVYGQHKLLMEGRVLDILPDAVVLRLTWMFEAYNPQKPHVDMVSRIKGAMERNEDIKASTRELRGITSVDAVCDNIIRSFDVLPGGVYNFGSGNLEDSYTTLLKVAGMTDLPAERIIPDDSWGRNLSMDCSRIESFGLSFPDTAESLASML